jgi:PAS domain S-box-containing protein
LYPRIITKELLLNRRHNHAILDNLAEAVIEIDSTGLIIQANRAAQELLGCELTTLLSSRFTDHFGGSELNLIKQWLALVSTGELSRFNSSYDSPLLVGDHQVVIKLVRVSEMDEFSIIAIFHDITQRKRVEEEKKLLQAQLLQAQKMEAVGTLAGGIAHDFNNILQIIQIYSELLLPETSADPFTEKNIKELNKAVNRGKELVHAILTYSRKTDIELVPQPCETLIRQSLAFIKAVLPPSVKIVENLSFAGNIMCNPNNIQQIIMNLATNSVTAMNEKGVLEVNLTEAVDPEINTKVHHGSYAKLEIKDTGVGMNEETKRRIFEPFFTTKKVGNGTGLGLSTVLGIVEKHNGYIECDSTPGLGSTFKIFFPIISNYESTVLD